MPFSRGPGAGTGGRGGGGGVKKNREPALLALLLRGAYFSPPAFPPPRHAITPRTRLYRAAYAVFGPLYPLWKALFPRFVTTTEVVGRAMLKAAKSGAPRPVLENQDINSLGS